MYNISLAKEEEKNLILSFYKSMLYGPADWDDHYPSMDTIEFDLNRDALFVMKNEKEEIIGTLSIDLDMEVERLDCWNKSLRPAIEVSRVGVREDMRNKGLAKKLMEHVISYAKRHGIKSIHILVRPGHVVAISAYTKVGFISVGNTNLYNKDFICMELEIK